MTIQIERPVRSRPVLRRRRRAGFVVWTVLSALVVAYVVVMYAVLSPGESPNLPMRPGVSLHYPLLITHIATGTVALALWPLQLSPRLRRRRRLHRWVGRVYLFGGVLPSAIVGIPVALLSVMGPVASAGLLVGCVAWLVTAVGGLRAARQHRYAAHARWMICNVALTLAAVTFRIWLPLLTVGQLALPESLVGDGDAAFDRAYALTTWLAFLPNLAVALWFTRRTRKGG